MASEEEGVVLQHAPQFKNMRLTEFCMVKQARAFRLWEVSLSHYQRQELDAENTRGATPVVRRASEYLTR